jgi:hypothetical protein
MTLPAFADFLYGSCLIDWKSLHKQISRHAQLLDEAEEVRIVGNETDLRLSVAGRRADVDAGIGNMPGGEFFVCPVETSGRGHGAPRMAWATSNETRAEQKLPAIEPITLHDARHTCASLWIPAGVHIKAISTFMGHASVTITLDRYGTCSRTPAGRPPGCSTGTSPRPGDAQLRAKCVPGPGRSTGGTADSVRRILRRG